MFGASFGALGLERGGWGILNLTGHPRCLRMVRDFLARVRGVRGCLFPRGDDNLGFSAFF